MNSHSLVVNGEVFAETSVPDRLIGRTHEVDILTRCLLPAAMRDNPSHVWVFGPSGTGKTAVARLVLSKLESQHAIPTAYVSCWRSNTLYRVADELVLKLRILMAEQRSATFKLERIQSHLAGKPFVVVLDELDQISPRDRSEIVRGLCGLKHTALVCISSSARAFHDLSRPAKSRLAPWMTEFSPYPIRALEEILADRARSGLAQGRWTRAALHKTALLCRGDARTAIQTLRRAAELADQEGNPVVRTVHVSLVWRDMANPPKDAILSALTEDHRALYRLVREREGITSGELYRLYVEHCRLSGRRPIAARTFSDYANRLLLSGLVTCERARLRGNVRLFKAA